MKKRVDGNQKEIVNLIKQEPSLSYRLLHTLGKGCPDILIGFEVEGSDTGANVLVEIKNISGKLNDLQKEFFAYWKGPIIKVKTFDELIVWLKENKWKKQSS